MGGGHPTSLSAPGGAPDRDGVLLIGGFLGMMREMEHTDPTDGDRRAVERARARWLSASGMGGLTRPAVGRLLVAMPLLGDPNFDRTVVLLVGAYDGGYQGVILSEPTRQDVKAVLPDWWQSTLPPRKIHRGGPCEPSMVMCLAVGRPGLRTSGLEPVATYSSQAVYRVEGDVDLEDIRSVVLGVRLFAGYSGWDAGQLADEIEVGAWLCVPSEPQDAVSPMSATLWRDVLARQSGDGAFLAHCPENPLRN